MKLSNLDKIDPTTECINVVNDQEGKKFEPTGHSGPKRAQKLFQQARRGKRRSKKK